MKEWKRIEDVVPTYADIPDVEDSDVEITSYMRHRFASFYPDWHADASCLGMPEHVFFGEQDEEGRSQFTLSQIKNAKTICYSCPVLEKCLETALINRERFGIWGATTARTRARIQRMLESGERTLERVIKDYVVRDTKEYEHNHQGGQLDIWEVEE